MASVLSTRLRDIPSASALTPLIQERYHVSTGMALSIATGALSRRVDAIALGRRYGLVKIETDEARSKGLLR